jgi:hypothetical protein
MPPVFYRGMDEPGLENSEKGTSEQDSKPGLFGREFHRMERS